jgi:hypothetical protein
MAEFDPNPPAAAPTPSAVPPFDPKAVLDAAIAVVTKPAEFFASAKIKGEVGFVPMIIFAVCMGVVAGVLGAVVVILKSLTFGAAGAAFGVFAAIGGIILQPIFAVIAVFVGGGIVHVIALISGGKGTYEQSARIAAYSLAVVPIAAVLGLLPIAPILAWLYGLYITALGIFALHEGAKRQTVYIVLGVLAGIWALVTVTGYIAAMALTRQLR